MTAEETLNKLATKSDIHQALQQAKEEIINQVRVETGATIQQAKKEIIDQVRIETGATIQQAKKEILSQIVVGTAAMIRLAKDETIEQIKEQMKKDKMEILGAVADFGKSTADLETGSNFLTARLADHEERLTKLEESRT